MPPGAISAAAVRDGLDRMRQVRPFAGSGLRDLEIVRRRLHQSGDTICDETVDREIVGLLSSIIVSHLARHRGVDAATLHDVLPAAVLGERLRDDFASAAGEREAWSCLYHRYVLTDPWRVSTIADTISPGQVWAARQIRRRIATGVEALASEIRSLEREAQATRPAPDLPRALTRFVGRHGEVAAIATHLRASRLVTLTGPTGIGKSRLALEAATAVADGFAGDVRVVDLEHATEASIVPHVMAVALGLRPTSGSLNDSVLNGLRDRKMLLVLDNCDHVLPACRALVHALLPACHRLSILATALDPLHLPGEVVLPVRPLSLVPNDTPDVAHGHAISEAVQLFLDRARAVDVDLAPASNDLDRVTRICERLEGFPLAIELAAPLVRLLSLEQLDERLADRFALLTHLRTEARSRHDALLAAMAWNYSHLAQEERVLLRRLSVFHGGWTLNACEAICTDADVPRERIIAVLAALADRGLIVPRDEDVRRYAMLETVRDYAAIMLREAGEEARLRDAHLAWYLHRMETAAAATTPADRAAWRRRLAPDHDNVQAARAWSATSSDVDGLRARWHALTASYLMRALTATEPNDDRRDPARSIASPAHMGA
jgi:predicted ATPase